MTRHPRLAGLLAWAGILALLAGLPALLWRLGWGTLPAVTGEWWQVFTTPDDGRIALLLLKAAAWVTWGLLALSTVAELVATLRGMHAPALPGLGWSQRPARRLVAAAMLLFVAAPAAGVGNVALAAPAAATPPSDTTTTALPADKTPASAASGPRHTVRPGDSLWAIAEQYLGSGHRYPDIARLNAHLLGGHDDFLRPGWVLTLPADAADPGTHTVQPGDTLSAIARTQLGDEHRWPEIYEASRHTRQPDHRRLTDPDLILPGWTLTLPAPVLEDAAPPAPAAAPAQDADPAPAEPAPLDADATQPEHNAPVAPAAPVPTEPTTEAPADPDTGTASPATAPRTSAAPAASAPTAAQQPASGEEAGQVESADEPAPPWLLAGLTGGGALLAGGLFALLRRRRHAQFRARRPGRTIARTPIELATVEKSVLTSGRGPARTLDQLDHLLRDLADTLTAAHLPLPAVAAVQLDHEQATLHLAEPAELPPPWQPESGSEQRRWQTALCTGEREPRSRAPYPQLVTLGQDDTGATWLVDLERLGVVQLGGPVDFVADYARYLAAEIGVNPWARTVRLHTVGIAGEATAFDPARIHYHPSPDDRTLSELAAEASTSIDRCTTHQVDVSTGRADDTGDALWRSCLLLHGKTSGAGELGHLIELIAQHPGRTATSIVLTDAPAAAGGVQVLFTEDGRVQVPGLDLDLVAVGLTPDEAAGCALLATHADRLDDEPMPPAGDDGWQALSDAAGAPRDDLVLPRDTDPDELDEPAETPIPLDAEADLSTTCAATPDDLNQLAPLVPIHVRERVDAVDTTLDADLADWLDPDCPRPRVSVLGPIQARVGPGGNPEAGAKRRAFYTEILTLLALNPNGVTADQLATALGGSASSVRKHLTNLRDWLGAHPSTGERYLPEATQSPAGRARGMGVYQLLGVLVDFDLFQRLRLRGQTRGDAGNADLRRALDLVEGEPFTGQREGGWGWLAEGSRIDHHAVCAIVDVAHTLTITSLFQRDLDTARAATQIAILAAPYDDTPQMDLASIIRAGGDRAAAQRHLVDKVANRSDDDDGPVDLAARTSQILGDPNWKNSSRVA